MSKKLKQNAQDLISGLDQSYEFAKSVINELPFFIGDVPLWVYACRQGSVSFFVADIQRLEKKLAAAAYVDDDDDDCFFLRTVHGFDYLTKDGVSIFKTTPETEIELADPLKVFQDVVGKVAEKPPTKTINDVIAALAYTTTEEYWELIGSFYKCVWPSFVDDVPLWLVAVRANSVLAYTAFLSMATNEYSEQSQSGDELAYERLAKPMQAERKPPQDFDKGHLDLLESCEEMGADFTTFVA
jgi:hypothetical protein